MKKLKVEQPKGATEVNTRPISRDRKKQASIMDSIKSFKKDRSSLNIPQGLVMSKAELFTNDYTENTSPKRGSSMMTIFDEQEYWNVKRAPYVQLAAHEKYRS